MYIATEDNPAITFVSTLGLALKNADPVCLVYVLTTPLDLCVLRMYAQMTHRKKKDSAWLPQLQCIHILGSLWSSGH